MSQNKGNFQSKSKKSAGKPRSGGKSHGAKGGFKGNKGKFSRDDRGGKPRSSGGKNFKSNDRRPKRDGDRDFKSYDRKPRRDDDRNFKSDRKPRRDNPRFNDREDSRDFKSHKKFDNRGPRKDIGQERDERRRKDRRDRDNQKTFMRPARENKFENKHVEASQETKDKLNAGRKSYGAPSPAFLYGIHPVNAALLNPKRKINRLLVTDKGFENIKEAYDTAIDQGLNRPEPTFVDKEDLNRLVARDAVHQDVVLDAEQEEEVFLDDILIAADDNTKIVILDQVTDPHNVGAILRSASAFGAAAVVVQKLHAPDITGVLAKSASGAVEYVPLVREVNLNRAIKQMKDAGFFCIGLDERGEYSISKTVPKNTRTAIVLGAEGSGMRRLVTENCDALAKLPTQGPIASLNVSNAAAVALYELIRGDE